MYKAYEIAPDIYWVGALEWNERYIHGFSKHKGSSNNAYIIVDDCITLIDTCIGSMEQELLERIADVVDPKEIKYIISNHSEKDHAGSIGDVFSIVPNAEIITSSPKGLEILKRYYGEDHDFHPVKTGDTLNIGKRTLTFVQTPFVHWPDNMVTYSEYDKILFSNDAFGQFVATSKRFDDEVDINEIYHLAKKYYANIVSPFAKQTMKAIDAIEPLDIKLIAPSHGVIWRSHIDDIIGLYRKWCSNEPTDSAVVAYSSMYGSTERIAETITEAFMRKGVTVRLYDLDISDISDIMTDVLDAKYLALGCPTHNGTVLPYMGEFLTYLKGLAPKGRCGIVFGSYGWKADSITEMVSVLEKAGYELPLEPFAFNWDVNDSDEERVFDAVTDLIDTRL